MKKISSILYFFILGVNIAFAQEKETRFQKELKLNLHIMFSADSRQLGPLSPVFTLVTKKHHRHDFELSNFRFSGENRAQKAFYLQKYPTAEVSHALWLRYQYTYSLLPEARFSPNLGASLQSRWSYQSFSQQRLRPFRYNEWVNHNFLELVPGVRWRLTDRIGIDYGIAMPLLQHTFVYGRLNSLALGDRAYGRYSIGSDPFVFFMSRLGVYIKL